MIGQTIAHYKISAKLGEGGMGEVFLATDTKLDRQVALKFLPASLQSDPESRERLLREARAASKLNHKNILTIYAVESTDGRDFIVMEYVDGKSLKDLIEATEQISIDQILRIGLQVCDGLSAAHEHGIVHRDIKPANILMTSKGQIKITDFGLATWRGAVQLTKEGTTVGTAAYMSPEQIQGKKVDPRSDLFSLGIMFYEMIASRRPFAGDHDAAISYAIMNDIPEPLARFKSGVHPALEQVVGRALEKDPATRYQTAADMLAELKRIRREVEGSQPSMLSRTMATQPKRSYLKYVIATSAVTVIALVLFVLKPFKFDVAPEQRAAASENSLAVLYFDNVADPSDVDKHAQMITSLLITDLSESQFLQVVSRQRLYDLLKTLGKEAQSSVDRNTATEIAKRAGVKWMLTGEILQSSPKFVITSQVSDASDGKVKSTQRITGELGEDIFAVVDKLSAAVRSDLATSAAARQEVDRPVASVTSSSEESYKEYLAGVEAIDRFDRDQARVHLQRAIDLDSTLAMAYFGMGLAVPYEESMAWMSKAMAHVENAAWNEQHFIRGEYSARTGDFETGIKELTAVIGRDPTDKDAFYGRAMIYRQMSSNSGFEIRDFLSVVALDPSHKISYNQLAYAYDRIGNLEKSLWAIDKYIEIAPNEPNPYDTRGDLYARNGQVDLAIASYRKALSIKPDFMSQGKLAGLLLQTGRLADADSLYRATLTHKNQATRSTGRLSLAIIPGYEGDFATALKVLNDGIAADELEHFEGQPYRNKLGWRAAVLQRMGDLQGAIATIQQVSALEHQRVPTELVYWRDYLVELYAESGDFRRADSLLDAIRRDTKNSQDVEDRGWVASAAGALSFWKGDYDMAVREYEVADSLLDFIFISVNLGRAYIGNNQLDKAVSLYEKVLNDYGESRLYDPLSSVLMHYYLAIAYERSGWNQKAAEEFEKFLGLWHKADPNLVSVVDARNRLMKLRS
jgi:serine/threonine protein kinase/Tfp pilus assembly protein PilF